MSKRRVSFGGVETKEIPKNDPTAGPIGPCANETAGGPVKIRKNNKIIENNDFNFGTGDQRSETQQIINEKGTRMKTGLHTIDSDDEEENALQEKKTKYKKLDMDKVKGLEELDPDNAYDEEGNAMTGFNLKDEMEEGEFDSTGQFHFKKREDTDEWLESVDWKKVRETEKESESKMDSDQGGVEDKNEKLSEKEILEKILEKMKPKESVTKCLQRLGTSAGASKIPAWKQKRMEKLAKRKIGKKSDTAKYEIESGPSVTQEDLTIMTNFVDQLSRRGYYDIYTDTYEKIKYKITTIGAKKEEVDMFGDPIDNDEGDGDNAPLEDSETKWEYKIGENGKITGSLTTSAMIKLKESAQSKDILCRRLNTNSSFYKIGRVDFDLW